jgi:HSP90 family molecular chaperone
VEVLYLVDPIDEFMIGGIAEFDGHKLQSAATAGIDLPDSPEEGEEAE